MFKLMQAIEEKLVFVLIFFVILGILIEPLLSYSTKSFFYGISLSFRVIMSFSIPIVVFVIVLESIIKSGKDSIFIIFALIIILFIFNLIEVFYALTSVNILLNFVSFNNDINIINNNFNLEPMFYCSYKSPIKATHSISVAFFIGIFSVVRSSKIMYKMSNIVYKVIYKNFKNIIVFCMPIFVFGFSIKLSHENVVHEIINNIPILFISICISCISIILIFYFFD